MTPIVPAHSPVTVACPDWCIGCDEGSFTPARQVVYHASETTHVEFSRPPEGDQTGGDMSLYLYGSNGEAPVITIFWGPAGGEVTIKEAEKLAAVLTSLITRARTATYREGLTTWSPPQRPTECGQTP
jgi:hypothetical protein